MNVSAIPRLKIACKKSILVFFYFFYTSQLISNDKLEIHSIDCFLDSVTKYKYNNYKKAYDFALKGLEIKGLKNKEDIKKKIRLLHSASFIEYQYLGKYYKSTVHLEKLKSLSDSINYLKGKALYQLNLSNIYFFQNDYKKSLETSGKAIEYASLIKDSSIIVGALIGKADIYLRKLNKVDSAKILIDKCIDYSIRNYKLDYLFLLYDDIAYHYRYKGMYDSSYYFYEKTLDVSEKLNNSYNILCTKLNLYYIDFLKSPSGNSLNEIKKIQERTKELGLSRLYYEAGYTISIILGRLGNFEKAHNVYKTTREFEDSVKNIENIRKVSELESAYKLQKKEFENIELNRINKINVLKLRNRKIFLFFTLFALAQSIILLYIIYSKYKTIKSQENKILEQERKLFQKEKETYQHKLFFQEKELTSKVMKIYHFNQLIQKGINEIKELKRNISPSADCKKIKNNLQNIVNNFKLSSDKQMWNEFEKSFIESHPGYLEKLSKKFPDLTSNEIKLCIFLFLNLRTKEISIITQQTINSINVARTRLRKKLDINNTKTSISVFLKNI